MITNFNPISLIRSICLRNVWRNSLRSCQTVSIDKEHHEAESCSSDPDMFTSDINNPFEKEKHNPRLLSQFVSSYTGFVYGKHITGLCEAQQKRLTIAIKRSQDAGFMAKDIKSSKYLRDPKLFDPFSPSRPNPY